MTKQNPSEISVQKLFSRWMVLLCAGGLLCNLLFSRAVLWLGLPIYLDNIGSILTAVLGGALPGMAVGFLSNTMNSVSEPISMYYGIITVLIAWFSARLSRRGRFHSRRDWLRASGWFVVFGGAGGSCITWGLYGGGIGGLAKPYAEFLCAHGVPEFFAQLTIDILLDIPDKLLTVGIVFLILRVLPQDWLERFPLGYLYTAEGKQPAEQLSHQKHTVNMRIIIVLAAAVTLTSITAVVVGSVYHHKRLITSYETVSEVYAEQAAACVNGDMVDTILQQGEQSEDYDTVKQRLTDIYKQSELIAYVYVYSVQEDGCHVVFDVDTPEVPGEKAGAIVPNEEYYYHNAALFTAGEEVPPEFTIGKYGALITGYNTVRDADGNTVAYAGVDINVADYILDMMTYVIQVVSILFAMALLIFTFALWYINRRITVPIQMIVNQSRALDCMSPELWLDSPEWKERTPVQTEDELEELYRTVCGLEENASASMRKLIETKQKLMQTEELTRINQELARSIQAADEANRAKTEFLSRMSHDIRTPLNAVLGTAELAEDELSDPAAMAESLKVIRSSGQFLLGLINDILDINKIESGNIELRPEPYSVAEFIRSVNSSIRPLAEKKQIAFTFEMNSGYNTICADKLRYKQIFFNLLSNAIKYTPKGGCVWFTTEAIPAADGIAGIRSIVRDNGIGMSAAYMEHLYEPFTRDSNAAINQTEGSGLGLAIVKSLVDAMDGTICVNSAPNSGTEFIVDLYLPLLADDAVSQETAEEDFAALQGSNILLVEDNAVNTRIAQKLLEKKGCAVTTAADGQAALDCFAAAAENSFDLILMDIRMPVMDGLEATRRLRAMERADAQHIPIIAMTANAYEEDTRKSLKAGMNAHLAKPIDPTLLYETLAQWLHHLPPIRETENRE